jgi:hypothetical protein
MTRYLDAFLISVLDGSGQLHGPNAVESATVTQSARSSVDLETRVDAVERSIMPLLGCEGRSARSPTEDTEL